MLKPALPALLALGAFAVAARAADMPPDAPPPAGCVIDARTYSSRDVSCAATPAGRGYVFRAHFSGGHDDTQAEITPLLDGRPLACDAGSKTRLFGEDGEVSLWCALPPQATGTLKVKITWSHAEYTNFEYTNFESAPQ